MESELGNWDNKRVSIIGVRVGKIIILCLCLGLMAVTSFAQVSNSQSALSNSYELEYDAQFAPVEFSDQGEYAGISADMIALIAQKSSMHFNKKASYDWSQTVENIKTGKIALIAAMVKTPERAQYAYFTKPYISIPVVLIARKGSPLGQGINTLAHKRLALVKDYFTDAYLSRVVDTQQTQLIRVKNVSEGLRLAALGQVDFFADNLAMSTWYLEKEGIGNLSVVGELPIRFDISIAVSKKYPELFQVLDRFVNENPESLEKIKVKWLKLDQESLSSRYYKISIYSLFGLLFLSLLFTYYRKYQNTRAVEKMSARFGVQLKQISANLPKTMVYQLEIDQLGKRRFTYISDGLYDLHGLDPHEVEKDATLLYDQVLPEDRPILKQAEEKSIANMEIFYSEVRIVHPQKGIRWMQMSSTPFRDEDRGVIVFNGIEIDIHERKEQEISLQNAEAEKAQLREQLYQHQKMEAIGQIAGGVAHDFNNVLGGIMAGIEILRDESLDEESRQRCFDLVRSAAERASDLTAKLLAFSRRSHKMTTTVNVQEIIEDTKVLLEHTLDKSIHIELAIETQHPYVLGDPSMLQNVFMNLGINASHAMPVGGVLRFIIREIYWDVSLEKKMQMGLKPGNYLQVLVSDTGIGMAEEILPKIFEPFFTTKEAGKGTGLGLASVYGTIKDHAGAVLVSSELGEGTEFEILLPLSADAALPKEKLKEAPTGQGLILLVDDEELIRMVSGTLIEGLGYRVLLASNGAEGLEMFEKHRGEIDLVILDMIMPVMGGRDAFVKIRKLSPQMPIIISSGFSKEEELKEIKGLGVDGFLKKPFQKIDLAEILQKALQRTDDFLKQ